MKGGVSEKFSSQLGVIDVSAICDGLRIMIDFSEVSGRWRALGKADPQRLTDARLNLHWAVQIVSAVGATYLPPQPDDSHTSLEWLAAHGVLAGQLINWERPFRAAIRPYDLMLQLRDENLELISEQTLFERSYSEGLQEMELLIESLISGSLPSNLSRGEYDLPDHEVARGIPFTPDDYLLKELTLWFSNADLLLRHISEQLDNVSPVRCWPHHFDIGIVIEFGESKTIGVGMEPGDQHYEEPYWYVRAHPEPRKTDLPELDGQGMWHEREWLGAVLTGSHLVKASPGDQQALQLGAFLVSAISACKAMLNID